MKESTEFGGDGQPSATISSLLLLLPADDFESDVIVAGSKMEYGSCDQEEDEDEDG